jgi:hypothetical protein
MESEKIFLQELPEKNISVRVEYTFSGVLWNPLEVGFPESSEYQLVNFQRTWNGKSVPVEKINAPIGSEYLIAGTRYPYVHTSIYPRTFRNKSTAVNTFQYQSPQIILGKGDETKSGFLIEYILITGSSWTGLIENIDFELQLFSDSCNRLIELGNSYSGKCKNASTWISKLQNLKPNRDFRLVLPIETWKE